MAGSDLMMFHCERKAMRLTVGACAKLWTSASNEKDRPAPWEGRHACIGCPVGAANCGQTIAPIQAAIEAVRDICPRCMQPGRRLIGRDLCVSCYNRDREALAGCDRKGHRPLFTVLLRKRDIIVCRGGDRVQVESHRARSRDEIIVRVVKRATGPVAFGRPFVVWHGSQMALGFGRSALQPARRPRPPRAAAFCPWPALPLPAPREA